MKVANVHQRTIDATPDRIAALVADFDAVWPTNIVPAPLPEGQLLRAGQMLWQEFARPGAVRAFRVVSPSGFRAEHWFEIERVGDRTVLRHVMDGEVSGAVEAMWRDRIEPGHDLVMEAVLDNVERLAAAGEPARNETAADAEPPDSPRPDSP